ncbi:hypothetical protein [Vulcanisaeta souniana]|uniref:hypothetical protein n=1 Tax=Vulcanisaeta souniana TaxID=164452 RepID=UPI0016693983|nr:hypothetical protein [Vulcanisaeta souniana]
MSAYLSPTLLLTASSQFLTIDPLIGTPWRVWFTHVMHSPNAGVCRRLTYF